ncbi:hypothetical protein GCM10011450_09380 [Advenella faeciporci]|uniref:NAD(P)-dependent oxidoreductase n=1 Tax=Advenella faeciporci TaxID=797535 RepID=A0A918JIW0_9BURK|nr:NAD(P)-dependent oxidoreductase [Advenella faeciporci]GGW81604.1 hypothetical protein GCM10011450_09380 [Advenella faeciporci]
MSLIKTVAFIGAGNMGAPMARNVQLAGYELIVCDLNESVLASFAQSGVKVTTKAPDCASADVIIVLLANDEQIKDALIGEEGLAKAIPEGRHPLICIMGTTLPDTLQIIKGALDLAGASLIDAPVSGGIVGAEKGTLTIMLGGEQEDIQRVMPLMESMGNNIFHCGALGSAEVVKVINNMLCVTNMFLTAEAIDLAERHGVSFEKFSPILAISTGLNFLTADAQVGRAQYAAWARSEEAYEAIYRVVRKDLHLALQLAELAQVDLDLLKGISKYVDSNDRNAMVRWMRSGQPSLKVICNT